MPKQHHLLYKSSPFGRDDKPYCNPAANHLIDWKARRVDLPVHRCGSRFLAVPSCNIRRAHRILHPPQDPRRAGRAGDKVGVGCVKTPALIRRTTNEPRCIERDTSGSLK